MKLRLALAAATCLALPLAAHAQKVTGPYVSLGAGTMLQTESNYEHRGVGDYGKFTTKPTFAGAGAFGYGFGNGLRVQLSGDYSRNTLNKLESQPNGTTRLSGEVKTYGPMIDVLYDFNPGWIISPYIGAGAGYQWQHIRGTQNFADATKGSFAYNVIGGLSYPLQSVPGLSVTAEYKFMQLTSSRNYGDNHIGQASTHTFLLGLRYQLFQPPAPVPAPAPAPVVAAPAPVPAKTFLVFFDWDKYNLTPRATQIIAQAADYSKTAKVTTLNVNGYTDTSGTSRYNMGLSVRRAKSVAAQLVADGVPANEISIHGYGETHLLVPTGPGVREPQNRRVEIILD